MGGAPSPVRKGGVDRLTRYIALNLSTNLSIYLAPSYPFLAHVYPKYGQSAIRMHIRINTYKICVYMYICIHIYIYICTYLPIPIYLYVYLSCTVLSVPLMCRPKIWVERNMYINTHKYIYLYLYISISISISLYLHIYILTVLSVPRTCILTIWPEQPRQFAKD